MGFEYCQYKAGKGIFALESACWLTLTKTIKKEDVQVQDDWNDSIWCFLGGSNWKLWGKTNEKVWNFCWYSSACDIFQIKTIQYFPKGIMLLRSMWASESEFVCSVVLCRISLWLQRKGPIRKSKWYQWNCSYSEKTQELHTDGGTYWRVIVSFRPRKD